MRRSKKRRQDTRDNLMKAKVGEVYGWKDPEGSIKTYVIVTGIKIIRSENDNDYKLVTYKHLGLLAPHSNRVTESYFLNTFKHIGPKNYSSKLVRLIAEEDIRDIIE